MRTGCTKWLSRAPDPRGDWPTKVGGTGHGGAFEPDGGRVEGESAGVRQRYGETDFGRSCLLARRFVEQQVPLVEVDFGGWDSHQNIFPALQNWQLPVMDCAHECLG